MKKIMAFLLAATMIFAFAACGNNPVETTPDITTTEVPDVQTTETTEIQTTETTTEVTTETTTTEATTAEPEVPTVDPTKIFNEEKIVLTFAAISDSQHKYSGIDTLAKLKTALTQLKAYAEETADGLDAVFFVGDLVQSAKTSEVKEFKSAYEAIINPEETPLVFALGNHDVNCASYTVEDLDMEAFYNIFGDAYRTYDEATSDLKLLDSLPGKKILGKGNHDFWWCTMKKHREHFEKHGITTISFLFNNAHETEDFIIAGTRGWFFDEKGSANLPNKTDFAKLTAREELRLETSLKEAKALAEKSGKEIIVFMHFPPVWSGEVCDGLIEILKRYGVKRVFYGHIHGNYTVSPTTVYDGIEMSIISADYLAFIPKHISKI